MNAFKKVMAGILAAGVLVPSLAFAQTSTTTTSASIQATLAQIQALETQMKALQAQQDALRAQYKLLSEQQGTALVTLIQSLKEGSSGDQVAVLQALLALDPSIYPEGKISGFFGRKTAEAVKRFQKKHGLEAAGVVGPKTLKKLNELLKEQDEDDNDDDDNDRGGKDKPKVVICHKGETKRVGEPSVFAHLRHGDTRGACGGTTQGDTTAPALSARTLSGVATTTATVSWATSENATGKVTYGTTSNLSSPSVVSTTTLSMSHLFALTGLTASTTYYYMVESKDAANNTATSSITSFNTTN